MLTGRQQQVLDYLRFFIAERGFPPTRREIASNFGWASANAVDEHLRSMERKGCIKLTPGISRGIKLVEAV